VVVEWVGGSVVGVYGRYEAPVTVCTCLPACLSVVCLVRPSVCLSVCPSACLSASTDSSSQVTHARTHARTLPIFPPSLAPHPSSSACNGVSEKQQRPGVTICRGLGKILTQTHWPVLHARNLLARSLSLTFSPSSLSFSLSPPPPLRLHSLIKRSVTTTDNTYCGPPRPSLLVLVVRVLLLARRSRTGPPAPARRPLIFVDRKSSRPPPPSAIRHPPSTSCRPRHRRVLARLPSWTASWAWIRKVSYTPRTCVCVTGRDEGQRMEGVAAE
jgi:hypothetical protein